MITWGDLFNYLDKKCNFHEKELGNAQTMTWTCKGGKDKTFVKEFCEKNNIHFILISQMLEMTGGYCDCEVLFNSSNRLKENDPIGKIDLDWSRVVLIEPKPRKLTTKEKQELK